MAYVIRKAGTVLNASTEMLYVFILHSRQYAELFLMRWKPLARESFVHEDVGREQTFVSVEAEGRRHKGAA